MKKHYIIEFGLEIVIVLAIAIIGFLVINFIITSGKNNKKDAPHALGLPIGSIRATLALTLVILFVFFALFLYIDADEKIQKDLAKSILTILGTLVIAVSSFYFGTKATEQGSKIAERVFDSVKQPDKNMDNIPPIIIQEAISKYKEKWIKEYDCINVKLGKKIVGTTQFELNCIVFFVKSKTDQEDQQKEIPSVITYTSKEKKYIIPTDVEESPKESQDQSDEVILDLAEELIAEKREEWIKLYKADAVIATLKEKGKHIQKVPCIQFIVRKKSDSQTNAQKIPEYFIRDGYKIPSDVIQEDQPTDDSVEIQPGDSVVREGDSSNGTIGLKVYRETGGKRTDYILSCYHVFCNKELKSGTTTYTSSSNPSIIAKIGSSLIKVADVVEGEFNSKLDASLSTISDDVSVNSLLKGYRKIPKHGIKIITSRDVLAQTIVYSYGSISKSVSGRVKARNTDRTINFFGKEYHFRNIIPVSKISVPGDSGAMVTDEGGKIIGIVFASNSETSFVIPISEIITHFNINIYYA